MSDQIVYSLLGFLLGVALTAIFYLRSVHLRLHSVVELIDKCIDDKGRIIAPIIQQEINVEQNNVDNDPQN